MPRGFFAESKLVGSKAPPSRIPKCGACGLYKKCHSPKMPPTGKGRKKILIIAEAPGEQEDKEGIQLIGNSGRYLMDVLDKLDIRMRRDCWLTNALICRPPGNETPDDKKIGYCRPNLIKTIEELEPEVIIPLGQTAMKSLLSWVYKKNDLGSISKWVGWRIPCHKPNAWICPTYHPSYLLRAKDLALDLHFERQLQAAVELEGRPWEVIPNYEAEIERITKPRQAAQIIREFISKGGPCAFDYETNMLKPDWSDARIVTASICWKGKRTIAFPFFGEAVDAMGEFITLANNPKIASNIKFEDRWTRKTFGRPVRNWFWDTMIASHVIDCRPDITSIKFQAFVLLGARSYNEPVEQFLRTKGNDRVNRILREIDLSQLLLYNGLDSLLEYRVAMKQREVLGCE